MEWMVGESPTDLFSVSTGKVSEYSDRQRVDAKRRLLDMVHKHKCNYPFLYLLKYLRCLILITSWQLDYGRSQWYY